MILRNDNNRKNRFNGERQGYPPPSPPYPSPPFPKRFVTAKHIFSRERERRILVVYLFRWGQVVFPLAVAAELPVKNRPIENFNFLNKTRVSGGWENPWQGSAQTSDLGVLRTELAVEFRCGAPGPGGW